MITEEENKKIDAIVLRAIPKVTCQLTEAANKEFRKGTKSRIIELLESRDKTNPFQPNLEYKHG